MNYSRKILVYSIVILALGLAPSLASASVSLSGVPNEVTVSPGETFSFTATVDSDDDSYTTPSCADETDTYDDLGTIVFAISDWGWRDFPEDRDEVEMGASSQGDGCSGGGWDDTGFDIIAPAAGSGSKTFNVTAPDTEGTYEIDFEAGTYYRQTRHFSGPYGFCDCQSTEKAIDDLIEKKITVNVTEAEPVDISVTTPSGPSSLNAGESATYSSDYDWSGNSAEGRLDVYDSGGSLVQTTGWMTLSTSPETKSASFTFSDEGTYDVCSEGRASNGGTASDGPKCMTVTVNPPPDSPECNDGSDNDGDGATDYPDDSECDDENDDNETPECSDGVDNDGDGLTDFGNDPECSSSGDDNESPQASECEDGVDNDSDGDTDYPNDSGCTDANDDDESDGPSPECDDGLDNDTDGLTDYPNDPECSSDTDDDESPQAADCEDTVDNDGDGDVDMDDSGCSFPGDDSEDDPACSDGMDNDGDGETDYPNDPGCDSGSDNDETSACDDGSDNDGDGKTDYPDDPDCDSPADDKEDADFFRFDLRQFFER